MFNKVLVGVDGHEGGEDAIALARQLMEPHADLLLANVYPDDIRISRASAPNLDEGYRGHALEILEKTREKSACAEAELRVLAAPSPARGLHMLAEAVDADLLVVGSSRRSLIGRVLLGDDTRAALNGAPCAIAIAPAGHADASPFVREVGVGYNGSVESDHALRVARVLAARHDAKLSAFEIVSLPAYLLRAGAPAGADIDDLLEQTRERLRALGGVEPHAAYGTPAEDLGLYSASLDLLVVGSRDYGPIGRLVHGSTSQDLARVARCPLLVLTRAARAQDRGATQPHRELVTNQRGATHDR